MGNPVTLPIAPRRGGGGGCEWECTSVMGQVQQEQRRGVTR